MLWLADAKGIVTVSEESLAAMLNVTPRALRQTVKDMSAKGLVRHQRSRTPQAGVAGTYFVSAENIEAAMESTMTGSALGMERRKRQDEEIARLVVKTRVRR